MPQRTRPGTTSRPAADRPAPLPRTRGRLAQLPRPRLSRSPLHWVAVAVAPILLAALAPAPGAAHAGEASCPDSKEFAVGGVGDPLGLFVPGTDDARGIVYPASLAPVGPVSGDVSSVSGELALESTVRMYRLRCPDTAIHITGFSFGALVAGNVRDRWTYDPIMRENMSFTLVSDPRADEGAMTRLPSVIPGFTHRGKRPPSTIPTSSVCRNDSDFICYTGNPLLQPFQLINGVLGYLLGDHGYRKSEVTHDPGEHVVPGTTRVPAPTVPRVDDAPALAADAGRLLPRARLSLTEYIPTPLCDYLPSTLAPMLSDRLGRTVLPSVPALRTALDDLARDIEKNSGRNRPKDLRGQAAAAHALSGKAVRDLHRLLSEKQLDCAVDDGDTSSTLRSGTVTAASPRASRSSVRAQSSVKAKSVTSKSSATRGSANNGGSADGAASTGPDGATVTGGLSASTVTAAGSPAAAPSPKQAPKQVSPKRAPKKAAPKDSVQSDSVQRDPQLDGGADAAAPACDVDGAAQVTGHQRADDLQAELRGCRQVESLGNSVTVVGDANQ